MKSMSACSLCLAVQGGKTSARKNFKAVIVEDIIHSTIIFERDTLSLGSSVAVVLFN